VDQVPSAELRKDDGCCAKASAISPAQLAMSDVRFGAESVVVDGMEIPLRRMWIGLLKYASYHLMLFVVHHKL
jgi:hypothetical protein